MCAVCGILQLQGSVDRDLLTRMTRSMVHRGPDDEGYTILNGRGVSVGLGFRRLSVIDLAGGHRPMSSPDGRFHMVFNGEIYNFQKLRRDLQSSGHTFRTQSDTEVLLQLYQVYGADCVHALNGMFAFAVWDRHTETLFAARDRFGKKPFYYCASGGTFLFASEIKALLHHSAVPRTLDRAALYRYLAYEYVPAPRSIFASIQKLPAAHTLTWRHGDLCLRRYWNLSFPQHPVKVHTRTAEDYAEELRERLREAVRLRLVSDVPLGVFLSGGIDSSSIVALMADLVEPSRIQTFCIGFREPSFDESSAARDIARHFGTVHHERMVGAQDLLGSLERMTEILDEPMADASIIPAYLLSHYTRQNVTVALGGDGGDELLAGYPTFVAHALARWYCVPRWLHHGVVLPLANRWPASHRYFSLDFKIKQFLLGYGHSPEIRNQIWLGSFGPAEQSQLLLQPPPPNGLYDDIARAMQGAAEPLQRLIYLYLTFYLQDDILVKADRASMACSLETRSPFLDHTFAEFANSLPPGLKLRNLQSKYILKLAMRNQLPASVLRRPKKGFGVPVGEWFKNELKQLLLDMLSPSRLRQQGLFKGDYVDGLLRAHLSGQRDNRKQLWTLLMFQLWYDRYRPSDVSGSGSLFG